MRAMVYYGNQRPLELTEWPKPRPQKGQVLIRVRTCAVCHTDLHVFDGELPNPTLPLILGHQIVGTIEELGTGVTQFKVGDRVGVPWLGESCGKCAYCLSGNENLCDFALYTGYQLQGGFAEYCTADARFTFRIPPSYSDLQAAPLLCAGLIGYRTLRMTEGAKKVGFYGFGASAHILIQVVRHQGGEVYVFTRKENRKEKFAKELGAAWVGTSEELPPKLLDAAIVFAPVGSLIPQALKTVRKGGIVVSANIHMSDIPSFPYRLLWGERMIRSVANLTRHDGEEFLKLAPEIPIKTSVQSYPLEKTNEALQDLRAGKMMGAAVVVIGNS